MSKYRKNFGVKMSKNKIFQNVKNYQKCPKFGKKNNFQKKPAVCSSK